MIQRTHDLAAVVLVTYRILAYPPASMTWETVVAVGVATIIGALIPDIDNVASPAWHRRLIPWHGNATRDFLQGHRHLSHSILGILLFSYVFGLLLKFVSLSHVDAMLVQQAFFLGQLSHLLADSLTIQGVPWLYPIPLKFGFPPLAFLRIKTGGLIEKLVVFPGLLLLVIYFFYIYRDNIEILLKGIRI